MVVHEDPAALDATREHVEHAAGDFSSRLPRHAPYSRRAPDSRPGDGGPGPFPRPRGTEGLALSRAAGGPAPDSSHRPAVRTKRLASRGQRAWPLPPAARSTLVVGGDEALRGAEPPGVLEELLERDDAGERDEDVGVAVVVRRGGEDVRAGGEQRLLVLLCRRPSRRASRRPPSSGRTTSCAPRREGAGVRNQVPRPPPGGGGRSRPRRPSRASPRELTGGASPAQNGVGGTMRRAQGDPDEIQAPSAPRDGGAVVVVVARREQVGGEDRDRTSRVQRALVEGLELRAARLEDEHGLAQHRQVVRPAAST